MNIARSFSTLRKSSLRLVGSVRCAHKIFYRNQKEDFVVRSMDAGDAEHVCERWAGIAKERGHWAVGRGLPAIVEGFGNDSPGFYVGEKAGKIISAAVINHLGQNLYWAGMYYVEEPYRRQGFGKRVFDTALSNAHETDHIGTEVIPYLAKRYTDYKWMPLEKGNVSARFDGLVLDTWPHRSDGIFKVHEIPFEKIVEYDNACFPLTNSSYRRGFLESWLTQKGSKCVVALNEVNDVVGIGTRRPGHPKYFPNMHIVGPLYANSTTVAIKLLRNLCRGIIGSKITMSIRMTNEEASKFVDYFALDRMVTFRRLYWNGIPENEFNHRVYVHTSPDVCGF